MSLFTRTLLCLNFNCLVVDSNLDLSLAYLLNKQTKISFFFHKLNPLQALGKIALVHSSVYSTGIQLAWA